MCVFVCIGFFFSNFLNINNINHVVVNLAFSKKINKNEWNEKNSDLSPFFHHINDLSLNIILRLLNRYILYKYKYYVHQFLQIHVCIPLADIHHRVAKCLILTVTIPNAHILCGFGLDVTLRHWIYRVIGKTQ